jgi:CMP-N-acetylneuraminic acid synthetase
MKVAAFLPAKGSSDRLPNKNTMLLDGQPLFLRGLRKLLACPSVDEVWLDIKSAILKEAMSRKKSEADILLATA